MKVFRFFGIDDVCAKSKKEAKKFYIEEYEEDDLDDIIEIPLDTVLWYGYDIDDEHDKIVQETNEKYRKNLEGFFYEIRVETHCDFDFEVKLSYKEVIKMDNIKESCIIASTER